MFLFKHTVRLLCMRWKRFALFLCLTALLCITAGLLGNYLLSRNTVVEPITLIVTDEDDSFESRLFFTALTSIDFYDGFLYFDRDTLPSAMKRLESGEATAVALIPNGFAQSVMSGENMPVSIWYSESTPLKSQLVRTYADSFTEMLKTSQIGVYTALDYARERGDDASYRSMYLRSNMGFLNLVAERSSLFVIKEVSATGQASIFSYYIVHAVVFLFLLSPILLLDVLRSTFSPYMLGSLHRMGVSTGRISTGCWGGFYLLYLGAGGVLAGLYFLLNKLFPGAVDLPVQVLPAAALVLATVAGFALLICSLFQSTVAGGMLVTAVSLVSLVAAGGIIPTTYLAGWVQTAGLVTVQHWLAQLLLSGVQGKIDGAAWLVSVGWCVLCCLLSAGLLRRRGRLGDNV